MGGGGGDTTNVTNTGLGDEQFTTLTENQANIGTSIDTARSDATGRFNTLDGTLSNIRGDISGVGTNLSSGFTNLQDLLGQNMEANQRGFTGVNTNINQATGQIQSGMDAGFTGVNQNLTDGFGTMDDRFDRVDTAQQTAQTAIDTGFQDQTNAFSDLDTRLTDDFNTANQNMTGGFAEVGQSLNDLDTNTQNRLDTVQGNVLTGQALLDQGITGMSNAQDIYYGDLSGRQMEIQQGQDQFQSNFDDYVQRYSEDTTLANQTRADLQQGMENSTRRIRDDLGMVAQSVATGQNELGNQLDQFSDGTQNRFNDLQADVTGGFAQAQSNVQATEATLLGQMDRQAIVQARDTARLASMQGDLSTEMRSDFAQLGSAFDDTGNLISSSIDAQGNTLTRQIDNNGNMLLRSFDATGRAIDGRVININRALNTLGQMQPQNTLAPVGMGATQNSGFAAPFVTTG